MRGAERGTGDGRRDRVVHGDDFDVVVGQARRLAWLGSPSMSSAIPRDVAVDERAVGGGPGRPHPPG